MPTYRRNSLQIGLAIAALALPALAAGEEAAPPVEATSLLGRPLHRAEPGAELARRQTELLDEALRALASAPDDPDAAIWVGRRTAYLGRYRDAIRIYSEAIARHPGYAKLYRHRGHRFISVRRLDDAIADLERAAELSAGVADEVEPDGLPNERGIPTSTSHTNIWYHLGLAYYLKGDFGRAAEAYRACRSFSTNPDMLVAASYWLYLAERRRGDHRGAAATLDRIGADLDIIENHDYYLLLRAYAAGGEPLRELLDPEQESVESATRAYGVGAWYLLEGDAPRARAIFERIVAGSSWAAFGYIAAEAELARSSEQGGTGR